MRTIIYCRKSRGTELDLKAQISVCKDYCKSKGYEISQIFSEIISSNAPIRLQYEQMLQYIKENKNIRVVATNTDRINRNLVSSIKLNELIAKTNSILETVSNGIVQMDSAENKMMSNMLANIDEYYYNQARQKFNIGRANAISRGQWIGGVPYGYNLVDKFLKIDPITSQTVIDIFTWASEGYSNKDIAERLSEQGITNAKGKPFNMRAVRLIIKSETYKGLPNCPAIVSEELWLKANNSMRKVMQNKKATYPLTGKIYCMDCSTKLVIGAKKDRGYQLINSCKTSNQQRENKTDCNCIGIKLGIVNNLVVEECKAYAESILDRLYNKLKEDSLLLQGHQAELQEKETEIAELKEQINRANKLFVLGNLDETELISITTDLKETLKLRELELGKMESFSLRSIVQDVQGRITKWEDIKEATKIEEVISVIDKVLYHRHNTEDLQIKVIFKEI